MTPPMLTSTMDRGCEIISVAVGNMPLQRINAAHRSLLLPLRMPGMRPTVAHVHLDVATECDRT